jgi:hypothetical protein
MTVNRPRDKGTIAESAVARYLLEHGWPYAERRSLKGRLDKGDITGTPGICWEVKWANGGLKLSEWMAQTEVETINANASVGILVIKPLGVGITRVDKWYAVTTPKEHDQLDAQASYRAVLDDPITYKAQAVAERLAGLRVLKEVLQQGTALHTVQAVPPNMRDFPFLWYRIMYLGDMINLLHSAGYGDEDSGGVSQIGT